jgi:hypothetical protein
MQQDRHGERFWLKIVRLKSGVSSDAGEHARPQLFIISKGEHVIGPPAARQYAVRSRLPF